MVRKAAHGVWGRRGGVSAALGLSETLAGRSRLVATLGIKLADAACVREGAIDLPRAHLPAGSTGRNDRAARHAAQKRRKQLADKRFVSVGVALAVVVACNDVGALFKRRQERCANLSSELRKRVV